MTRPAPGAPRLARMKTPICLALAAALALPAVVDAAPVAPVARAAKKKRKECEFTKKKARKKKARLCADAIGESRWIVVSGSWKEKLTVHDTDDDGAVFDGSGSGHLEAGGLSGDSAFPSRSRPTVSIVSTRRGGVSFGASSHGGWTSGKRYFDCSFTAPADSAPNGFGGIFTLSGKRVSVQWLIGATGFGCGEGPYPTPSPDFPDTVSSYPLSSFENRRLVTLPITFELADTSGSLDAHVTYEGTARLRRYR
jgi:hypothetical protein